MRRQRPRGATMRAPQRNLAGATMNAVTFWRSLFLACLLATGAALAQPAAFAQRYSPAPASADGIGKRYMGREIAA